MKKTLWEFIDNQGSFVSKTANQLNSLYFPLCNSSPFMSSISPHLRGDIKIGFNAFLLEPVSRISLNNSKSSRNFWIYINPRKVWSVTGVSKDTALTKKDEFSLEAGLLWQSIRRKNKKIGLESKITSFIPSTNDPAEIMQVEITNISSKKTKFIPTAVIPIFGRGPNNLHDHRHVTSLLNRIKKDKSGIILTPTLSFDESGHKKNQVSYFVFGIGQKSENPEYIYQTQEEVIGESSDLESPAAVFNNILPEKNYNPQGKEAAGGLRFKAKTLQPKETYCYIILMGITKEKPNLKRIFSKFNTIDKVQAALETTKDCWQKKSVEISCNTGDKDFDNWLRWVNIQPVLRKIFGCSFLPDFDYGKGGRGWRDLWQDCFYLILTNPAQARQLLINNFKGVRIDGSNATIIGQNPGEFIADRNNISRVWMDHGIWPLITTQLYIHQSSDFDILFEEIPYFRDHQLCRGQERDFSWSGDYGKELKTRNHDIYKGTVFEHILVENLVQFFNVGPHNHIRLENADWNDGLDMAYEFGESAAFTAMYAQNLKNLCRILEKLKRQDLLVLKELSILLDTLTRNPIDYSCIDDKRKVLDAYFHAVKYEVDGEKISLPVSQLILDLTKKSDWISEHIQKTEWLDNGFFNGYYNNDKQKVEGKIKGVVRMTLTGQVFPIMSGIATDEQINTIFKNARTYLKDKQLGGFHLNTDFKAEQLNLGRAFSFIYGDKENGAFFNHMAVMFAYALYNRGFVPQGYEVLDSIYRMAVNTEKSRIFPCLPEYFDGQGRGMYSYLTGSASWFIFTVLTQVFGVRAEYGDLNIEPKLTSSQFRYAPSVSITTTFAGKPIEVKFINPQKKDFGGYLIQSVKFNTQIIARDIKQRSFLIKREDFFSLSNGQSNKIEVILD
ncbi:MAG: cellobiose phosphorylase [Candidatus Omnitrophota bacterium]